MYISSEKDRSVTEMEKPKGGDGVLILHSILHDPLEAGSTITAFSHAVLNPGSGIGYHQHIDATETIFILSGEADYTDDRGEHTVLVAGDTAFCDNMEHHSLYCRGCRPVEFIALIMNKKA